MCTFRVIAVYAALTNAELCHNVSIRARWEGLVDAVLKAGRYGSACEVVCEGLRLVEEREAKLQALRETLRASIAAGGAYTDDDVGGAIEAEAEKLAKAGY